MVKPEQTSHELTKPGDGMCYFLLISVPLIAFGRALRSSGRAFAASPRLASTSFRRPVGFSLQSLTQQLQTCGHSIELR
jgi:hypothetical protein